MATKKVLLIGDNLLTKRAHEVTKFDKRLHAILDDMKDTLFEYSGVGLAAPQIGIMRRIFIVDTGEEIIECVNPQILETNGENEGPEACLSVPGKQGVVTRPVWVKIGAYDRNGVYFEAEGEEYIARCFCHENDHLDGKLFVELTKQLVDCDEIGYEEYYGDGE